MANNADVAARPVLDDILVIDGKPGLILDGMAKARRTLRAPEKVTKSLGKGDKASYREVDDVVTAARVALNDAGVIMTIREQTTRLIAESRAEVSMTLVFTAMDGSRMCHETAATAINGMGKSVQCAVTAAVKQGLRYVLMIATGEGDSGDPDEDAPEVLAFMKLVYDTPLQMHRDVLDRSPEHRALSAKQHRTCQRLYKEYLKTERAKNAAVHMGDFGTPRKPPRSDDEVGF